MRDVRKELVDLVTRLIEVSSTEKEEQEIVDRITSLSPDPAWSDYLFYPKEFVKPDGNVEVEQVVDKMLSSNSAIRL